MRASLVMTWIVDRARRRVVEVNNETAIAGITSPDATELRERVVLESLERDA